MKKVIEICNELSKSKVKASMLILQQNKDNEKLKTVLNFVFNPYVTSGISDKKYNKEINTKPTMTFKRFVEVLDYIQEHNTGTDEIIANIQNYVNQVPEYTKQFIHDVITKQLKLGVGITTINKAFGYEFIPTFDVQLAEKYYDNIKEVKSKNKEFTLTLKLDGHRCLIIKNGNKVTLYARSGQIITGCEEIEQIIAQSKYNSFVLDGELLAKVKDKSISSKERFRMTLKEVHKNGIKNNVEFFAFDYLPLDNFMNKKCILRYNKRRKILYDICSDLLAKNKKSPINYLNSLYIGNDYDKVEELLAKVRRKHLEGLMMNINDAYYEFKRSKTLLKIKVMEDVDLRILEIKHGNGKLRNTTGKIICDYKGYKLGVGSGMSDEDRKDMWDNPDNYIGKLAKIQYFEETQNDSGELSLRFPVYLGLSDKMEGDFENG